MFPTTMWSTIRQAAASDGPALERLAEKYRPAIVAFLRRRGFCESDADDVCQDVFVRLLAGRVLANADPAKGRFRSLLLAVTTHQIQDRLRRRSDAPLVDPDSQPADRRDADFDRQWVVHLANIALDLLEEQGSAYFAVLRDHLAGERQDRQRLWIARRKLIALIRHEIALTCATQAEFEEEVAYLSAYLRPRKKSRKENETTPRGPR